MEKLQNTSQFVRNISAPYCKHREGFPNCCFYLMSFLILYAAHDIKYKIYFYFVREDIIKKLLDMVGRI